MRKYFASLLLLLLAACGGPNKEALQLQQETERIHDEAMADLASMNRLAGALRKELAALDSLAPRRDSLAGVLARMDRAEDDMFGWMKQYKAPDPQSADAVRYLTEQKKLIEKNRQDIRDALAAGQPFVQR